MKKVMVLLTAIVLALTAFMNVAVYAEDSRVEIDFCVGDDTLNINGEAVKVVKPYVVGEGVTLVPVRVITEAFGAKVDWVNETQTVKLTYPDVKIVLQIGNSVAEINGRAETLLAAPELTGGSTMVPLRFISENFGADVSYDNATERITVVKEASSNSEITISGTVDSKYIGDSYYGWSMENPADMQMTERYFDGTYTFFEYDENNGIQINVKYLSEDYDFEKSFSGWKDILQSFTLVKADKDASKKTMHLQAKDKEHVMDIYEIVTDKYAYVLTGIFENEKAEIKNEGLKLMESFNLTFSGKNTYDLSNVKNGVRKFESAAMKLSFDVPENFLMLSDEDAENRFVFLSGDANDDSSGIIMNVYSKSSVDGAEALANKDFIHNKRYCNEELAKFDSNITQNTYTNFNAFEYSYEINAALYSEYDRDVFFEIGDYVYNIHVSVKLPNANKEAFVDAILNSIKAEKLDFSTVGEILYNFEEKEGTFVCEKLNKCKITIPNDYEEIQASKSTIIYSDGNIVLCGLVLMDEEYTYSKIKNVAKTYENAQKKTEGYSIIQPVSEITLGKNKYVKLAYKGTEDDKTGYVEIYLTVSNGAAYIFEISYSELAYSEFARNQVKEMMSSAVFK